ncbi:hypothetical protein MMC21_004435 [Puttea exsequens]|nr:hypothetical protein [Puttea exsequens]
MTKPQPRRTRSSQDDEKEQNTSAIEDDIDGEEEITRCICGNQDYPGLPIANNNSKPKSDSDPPSFTEDATGWFIQCDNCHVWQHGGCVGLLDENTSPDEYFCEQCHPELHRVATMANGRKHSHYVPAEDANSDHSSPVPTPKSNSRKSRDSKAAQMNSATVDKGRRSTMNSRDAAYEEEQLRLAIEESKREGGHSAGTRKGKRGRSESEERTEDTKRQRTTSGSASSNSRNKNRPQAADSEGEAEKSEKPKNIRGAAARNHQAKEARDREAQLEKERLEGARKRRPERGREEESDVSPEPMSRNPSTRGTKPATSFAAPPPPDHPPTKASHKKAGGRPAKKKSGRNQYTKDRDPPAHSDNSSPAHSNSSQNANGHGTPRTNANGYSDINCNNGVVKHAKPKQHTNSSKTTMNELRRRAASMLQFISTTQLELAGSTTTTAAVSSSSAKSKSKSSSTTTNSTNTPPPDTNGDTRAAVSDKAVNAALERLKSVEAIDPETFAGLSSLEMMEVLATRLVKWQEDFGKVGDKSWS